MIRKLESNDGRPEKSKKTYINRNATTVFVSFFSLLIEIVFFLFKIKYSLYILSRTNSFSSKTLYKIISLIRWVFLNKPFSL